MKFIGAVVAACAAAGVFAVCNPRTSADSQPGPGFASGDAVSYRTDAASRTRFADSGSRTERSSSFHQQAPPSAALNALPTLSNAALQFVPSQLFKLLSGWWLSATDVQVGDVTGDGRLDIVVLARPVSGAPPGTFPKSTLYVFRQEPQGGFGAPIELKAGSIPYLDLRLGDVDGNGATDIVATSSGGLVVYMYRPDGTFQYASTGGAAQSLGLLDVDLDGRLDAVTRTYASGAVVWYGDGKGGFPRYDAPHVIWSGHQFAIGDVTSDGLPDIVAPDNGQYLAEVVPHGQITGGAPTRYPYEPSHYGSPPAVIGDFNHDGRNDVALAIQEEPTPRVHVRHQNATRTLGPPSALTLPERGVALVAADMDGNNRDDLVMVYGRDPMKFGILLQTDNGFAALLSIPGMGYSPMGPGALAVGDLNSDGCRDAVAVTGDQVVLLTSSGCRRAPAMTQCLTQLPVEGTVASHTQALATPRRGPLTFLVTEPRVGARNGARNGVREH